MFAENFWKIIFVALVAVGCWFWWKSTAAEKKYQRQIATLATYLDASDSGAPKSEREAHERVFQAVAMMKHIMLTRGKKKKKLKWKL